MKLCRTFTTAFVFIVFLLNSAGGYGPPQGSGGGGNASEDCFFASVQPCGTGWVSDCTWASSPGNCSAASYYENLGPDVLFRIPVGTSPGTPDGAASFSWGPDWITCYYLGGCVWEGSDEPIGGGQGYPTYDGECVHDGVKNSGGPQALNLHGSCE